MFEKYQKDALKRHNELRQRHENTPPMELNQTLSASATVSFLTIMLNW